MASIVVLNPLELPSHFGLSGMAFLMMSMASTYVLFVLAIVFRHVVRHRNRCVYCFSACLCESRVEFVHDEIWFVDPNASCSQRAAFVRCEQLLQHGWQPDERFMTGTAAASPVEFNQPSSFSYPLSPMASNQASPARSSSTSTSTSSSFWHVVGRRVRQTWEAWLNALRFHPWVLVVYTPHRSKRQQMQLAGEFRHMTKIQAATTVFLLRSVCVC